MSRIPTAFTRPSRKALIAYVTVGYPSVEATLEVVPLLVASGCDLVELGIPFSDPLADGVTIQKASFQALQNGVTPAICLEVAGQLSKRVDIPLVFMTYYNPILKHGHETFCHDCSTAKICRTFEQWHGCAPYAAGKHEWGLKPASAQLYCKICHDGCSMTIAVGRTDQGEQMRLFESRRRLSISSICFHLVDLRLQV